MATGTTLAPRSISSERRAPGVNWFASEAASPAEAIGRPAKEFWPPGLAKVGHFHLLGAPQWIVLVAEGYATAASLHMATGFPVAVAFDAGNLVHVAKALRARYRGVRIVHFHLGGAHQRAAVPWYGEHGAAIGFFLHQKEAALVLDNGRDGDVGLPGHRQGSEKGGAT